MIRIDFSPDKVRAWITILDSDQSFPTFEMLMAEVKVKGINFGLDESVLRDIANKKQPVRKVLIATGKAAEPGRDAQLIWLVRLNDSSAQQIPGSDRVDFKATNFSQNVTRGQALVKKTVAEKGKDGLSVLGAPVSSMGKDIPLPAGRNTQLSEDGLTLLASINGTAFIEKGLVQVDEILHVKGNVSYATGNIKFDGPVVIEGDVLSGFRVEARDSIYIGGNVEAANVYSQQGDITINYGILGKGRAKVLAGGNLKCGFVQDATVGVRKDVTIERYAINSDITSGGKVLINQNEGLVRGGSIIAEKGIEVNEAGSTHNVYTELQIQNRGETETQSTLWELSRKRSELNVRLDSLSKRKSFLEVLSTQVDDLSPEKKEELDYISGEIARLGNKIEELNVEERNMQKTASKARILREVQINKTMHKNVVINISGVQYHNETPIDGVKFYRFKKEIIVESLLDLESQEYDIFIANTSGDK